MNEQQARQLAQVYASMGYQTKWEQTGGGVHVVYVCHGIDGNDGKVTVFGHDSVEQHASMADAEWAPEGEKVIVL